MAEITETRKIRLKLGLTQEQMARKLGVAVRTFTRWDTGEVTPSAPTTALMRSWLPRKMKAPNG